MLWRMRCQADGGEGEDGELRGEVIVSAATKSCGGVEAEVPGQKGVGYVLEHGHL